MAASDAKPVPQKNVAYRVYFPVYDADGDLATGVSWTSYQYSTDNGAATSTAAPTETSLTGIYYVDLTNTIMNGDNVILKFVPSTAGAKATTIVLYPEEAGDIRVNMTQCNGTGVTGRDIGASVLLSPGTGTGQISLSSGAVTVGTNNDKTGYTASTVSDKTGYSLADATSDSVIADAVWNALTASYGSANTYGALIETGNVGGGNIVAASVTAAVTAGTVSDKTGYTVSTVSDKTGYSLTQAFPTNFSSLAITVGGAVTAGTVSDKAGYSISGTKQTLDALNDITAASVWAVATRAITDKAGFTISGTKTTLDALNDITAASVWAVGTREITGGTVGTVTNGVSLADSTSDAIIADAVWNALTATYGDADTYGAKVESLVAGLSADDVWDEVVDSTYTARQLIRGISSVLFGESAGGGTSTLTFRDLADTKTRITATVDADGNRTAMTINSLT